MDCHASSIRMYKGKPSIFVGETPIFGAALSHNGFYFPERLEDAYDAFAALNRRGISIFRAYLMIETNPDGSIDTDALDDQMRRFFEIDPNVLVLARIFRRLPLWWIKAHPDQIMQHRDPYTGEVTNPVGDELHDSPIPTHYPASFSSQLWRQEAGDWIEQAVGYLEDHYGSRILAYFLHGGVVEWAYGWNEVLSDFSLPQRDGFREWLRARYGNDTTRLRSAWRNADADFDAVEVPFDRIRPHPDTPVLLEPGRDQRLIDYLTYHSQVVADAFIDHAGRVKTALAARGTEKICGSWYGYDFWPAGRAAHVHNSGHHGLMKTLDSDAIDFYIMVHSHQERYAGGIFLQHLAAGSVNLHGRLIYEEEDTATHALAEPLTWQEPCADLDETKSVLTRNLMGTLSLGGSLYWHDFAGEHWFDDPGVADHIQLLRRVGEQVWSEPYESHAQVAVFVSKSSKPYWRQDAALTDSVLARQISELSHLGAPIDVFEAEDLPLLAERGLLPRYRLAVFLDAFVVPDDQRRAISGSLCGDGRTVLWLYGAGFITGHGFDPDAMVGLTGIPVELRRDARPLKAGTGVTGSFVEYGTTAPITPCFVGRPDGTDGTETIGWYMQPADPALVSREMDGWRSIWSGAPEIPAAVLRRFAREAGVHVFAESGDQIFRFGTTFSLHAAFSGERRIGFPAPVRITDLLTGDVIAEHTDEIVRSLRRGETLAWRCDEAG